MNILLLARAIPGTAVSIVAGIALGCFYIAFNLAPQKDSSPRRRLRLLAGGYELLLAAMVCFSAEVLVYAYLLLRGTDTPSHILLINALFCTALLLILLLNGIIRIFTCSSQLGIMPRICLLLFWWVPIVNLVLFRKFFRISGLEYTFTASKLYLNQNRKQEELCKTNYPLLMVHGIFFRDWANFNYWGRIPKELTENGATIYYGNHQSSASVEQCAAELEQCIREIVQTTGCEKVNIIAHSKGGLDSRYAISCLQMGRYVASLTTINTPHYGCSYVRKLLEIIPKKAVSSIGQTYESLYTKLGDDSPDFFSGLKNLTDEECARLNDIMPDDPDVLYQSVGSYMHTRSSSAFPLNLGYSIIKRSGGGKNDGLVSLRSMEWGNYLGTVSPKTKQGISHGDMIDLTRKNIEGFDVCEFYVDLAHHLKLKGL